MGSQVAAVLETNEEERRAQAKIWKLTHAFVDAKVLRSAVELGFADIIHSHRGPISLSELISRLPLKFVDGSRLHRMMRYLVYLDIFTQVDDQEPRYGLSKLAEKYLVRESKECMGPLVLAFTDQNSMKIWHYLKEALVPEGPSPGERAYGVTVWEDFAFDPEKSRRYNEAMAWDARILTSALITECGDKFAGIRSIVDVGGGTGATMVAVANAFPHISCTVFDLPHVIDDDASPHRHHPGIARVKGDMFDSVPAADAVLLKSVLRYSGDEDCVKILKRCKKAVPEKGGKVFIIEYVLDDCHNDMKLLVDMVMMVGPGGKERTEVEWKRMGHI